ncbi:MAG: hypothetical protein KF878_01650 [Planctomycetes bacterium]|nr:hypothetical protein [Planctomycetota bacterium]
MAEGARALRRLERLEDPAARRAAADDWLAAHPHHPARAEVEALARRARALSPLRTIDAPPGTRARFFLEDGPLLLDLLEERVLRRIDPESGVELARSTKSEGEWVVCPAPGGFLTRRGGELRRWDADLHPLGAVPMARPRAGLCMVATTPDGRLAVLCLADGEAVVVRVADGSEVLAVRAHAGDIDAAAFTPDGGVLLTGGDSRDPTVRLWSIDGRLVRRVALGGNPKAAVFDPTGGCFYVATSVGRIYAVPLDPALPPREPLVPPAADGAPGGEVLPGAHGTGVVRGLARAPDADRLWSVAGGTWPGARQLRAWDLRTGALRYEVAGLGLDPARLVVSPSGRLLAVSSEEGPVQVWATD